MVRTSENTRIFDPSRTFVLGDPELNIIGSRQLLAKWRHIGRGPVFYRLGRKIVYHGEDLNAWADAQRVKPSPPENSENPPHEGRVSIREAKPS